MFNFKKALKLAFLGAVLLVGYGTYDHYKSQPIQPMTLQRRSSHRIEYKVGGRTIGSCTGTAIAPHAILTATHCNDETQTDTIQLDMRLKDYHIEKTLTDGRDHDIYLVDGESLTNYVDYKVRPAKVGEPVYLYGSGEAIYPPRRLDGIRLNFDDPSDVDADAGIVQFTMPVIPGDSGSAVFAKDGSIVGVTTYLLHGPWMYGFLDDSTTVDFLPAFSPEQISQAESFAPHTYVPPARKKGEDEELRLNPLFFLGK